MCPRFGRQDRLRRCREQIGNTRGRAVLCARADRIAAEVVRYVPARAKLHAGTGGGFDVSDPQGIAADHVAVPSWLDGTLRVRLELALHGHLERRLVAQLVVPAAKSLNAACPMHQILRLLGQRPGAEVRPAGDACDGLAGGQESVLGQQVDKVRLGGRVDRLLSRAHETPC